MIDLSAEVMREAVFEPGAGERVPPDVGGKAAGLLAIVEAGLPTPPWFVVLPGSVEPDGTASDKVRAQIGEACRRLGAGADATFAIRSSALDEDAPGSSFAGQYRSWLDVRGDAVIAAVADCVRWSAQGGVDVYRRSRGQASPGRPPAVIVQRYVVSNSAGVAFSRSPITGADEVVIAAARRAGALTGGEVSGDEYRVSASDQVSVVRLDPDTPVGSEAKVPKAPKAALRATPEERRERILSDAQVRQLARATRLLERRRSAAQDVEWAYSAAGQLSVLQARPITALPTAGMPRTNVRLWDNANIVESFPELTLPLTFSIAAELYASVYRAACIALGVSHRTVDREGAVFEEMLGLLQGRVFYNLHSWYRVLSLLPGFRLTAGFMEAMMGARRPGAERPDAGAEMGTSPAVAGPARWWELTWMTLRLVFRLIRFGADARRFRAAIARLIDRHRDTPAPDASPGALLAAFDGVRDEALADWRAPIMNDLFLMMAHGALRRLAGRWLGPEAGSLVNILIVEGSVASAQPGRELLRIASSIEARADWAEAVRATAPEALHARLGTEPGLVGLAALVDGYLQAWGERAPRELQLERPSYRDDPVALLRALRPLVGSGITPVRHDDGTATRRVRTLLLAHRLGRIRLGVLWILVRWTRRHIRWREEMRLARGQVFGLARRIVRRLGRALQDQGALDGPEDVHYLTLTELRAIVSGSAMAGDPRWLVGLRRAQYATYGALPLLPSRFETRGPITDPLWVETIAGNPADDLATRTWRGTGAASGRARGACLVVLDPVQVTMEPGRIIVARSTDPGWVPILVGAAGLLAEQGSLLSHSAIVARELGIPTVVGLPGLLDRVRTGDMVELDGSTGEVRLLTAVVGATDAAGAA